MHFVAEHKQLLVRALLALVFACVVVAALLYHTRPKWLFSDADEREIAERMRKQKVDAIDHARLLYNQNVLLKAYGRSLAPAVVQSAATSPGGGADLKVRSVIMSSSAPIEV